MNRWIVVGILFVGFSVAGCTQRLPDRASIETTSGAVGRFSIALTASTNCAAVGEPITFTVTLKNLRPEPLTLTDTPPLELVLRPSSREEGPRDVLRWSADPRYPAIDPVLAGRDVRRYTWVWHADRRYASTASQHEDGVVVELDHHLTLPPDAIPSQVTLKLMVGVRSMPTGMGRGRVLCTELPMASGGRGSQAKVPHAGSDQRPR